MTDNTPTVLATFHAYAKAFELLKPAKVLPFYHFPAILISSEKAVSIKNWIEGFVAFVVIMRDLKQRHYDHSETQDLNVR